jgi:hypothetical protein
MHNQDIRNSDEIIKGQDVGNSMYGVAADVAEDNYPVFEGLFGFK